MDTYLITLWKWFVIVCIITTLINTIYFHIEMKLISDQYRYDCRDIHEKILDIAKKLGIFIAIGLTVVSMRYVIPLLSDGTNQLNETINKIEEERKCHINSEEKEGWD